MNKDNTIEGIPFRSQTEVCADAGSPFVVWAEIERLLGNVAALHGQDMENLFPQGAHLSPETATYLFWVSKSLQDLVYLQDKQIGNRENLQRELLKAFGFSPKQGGNEPKKALTIQKKIQEATLYEALRKKGWSQKKCFEVLNSRFRDEEDDSVRRKRITAGKRALAKRQAWHRKA